MRKIICGMVALAAAAVLLPAATRADLTIVDDGKSEYVIVVAKDASPSEKFAAEELQVHLQKMSGAKLPIQELGETTPEKAICLGWGSTHITWMVRTPKPDGYIIQGDSQHQRIVILGDETRGVLYGVYTLLERLGVRWWYANETTIPEKKTVVAPPLPIEESPRLEYRDMMFRENYSDKLWMARNKVNGMAWDDVPEKLGGRYKFVGNLVHSYTTLLQKSGHEIVDEMKALRGGKRTFDQPCLSSEKTVAAMVDGVLKAFEANPDARFVVVGQMDNNNYCQCPECAAVDEAEGSHAGQVIRFANRVAEEVEKRRPGSAICTAAYSWSRKPPKNLRPRDNVYITLCSIECDFSHPLVDASNPENQAFKEDIEGWGKIAKKIFLWHYVGNRDHYLMPDAELETLVPNIRFFVDNGCAGVFNQGTHNGSATDMTMLKQWVLAHAMWNPQADSRALIEEFCRGFYGPSGDDVLKYIDVIHAPAHQGQFHNGRRVHLTVPYLRPEVVAEAEVALRAAEAHAPEGSDFARRVRHAHMGVWYVLAKRGPGSKTWQAVEKRLGEKIDPVALADRLAGVVGEWRVNAIIDNAPVKPWIEWLKQYMARVKELGHAPRPPELDGADPAAFRLVQADQLDMTPEWWRPAEGAGDGYAAHVPKAGWYTTYALSSHEDFTAGRTYLLRVRAKGDMKAGASGDVWEFGVYPKGKTVRVDAKNLADGAWHVFDLGPWQPADGQRFWTALIRNPNGANSVAIDCLWLVEAPAKE